MGRRKTGSANKRAVVRRKEPLFRVIGSIFTLLGLILMIIAVVLFHRRSAFLQHAVKTDGRVIELVMRRGSKGAKLWAPRVEFTSGAAARASFVESAATSPPLFHVGEIVRVAYEPGHEAEASIDSFSTNWMSVLILGPLSVVFVGLGSFLLWSYFRK